MRRKRQGPTLRDLQELQRFAILLKDLPNHPSHEAAHDAHYGETVFYDAEAAQAAKEPK